MASRKRKLTRAQVAVLLAQSSDPETYDSDFDDSDNNSDNDVDMMIVTKLSTIRIIRTPPTSTGRLQRQLDHVQCLAANLDYKSLLIIPMIRWRSFLYF